MAPAHPSVGGLPESKLRVPCLYVRYGRADSRYVSLDQNQGAQMVKNREKERIRKESSTVDSDAADNSTTDATANATTAVSKYQRAVTSTTPAPRLGYIFSSAPGPLPCIYGTILSSGRN